MKKPLFSNFGYCGSMLKFLLLAILMASSVNSYGAIWFASPGGTGNGTSILDPSSLQQALSNTSIAPGDTVFLLAGNYVGRYTSNIQGSSANHITVMPYKQGNVVFDGNTGSLTSGAVLLVKGGYVDFYDIEITYKAVVRKQTSPGFVAVDGINHISGFDCQFINLVIHDLPGTGVSSWKETSASMFYGCIVYNNGWIDADSGIPAHGPGFYVQNEDCRYRRLENNIVFNNFKSGMQIWSASTTASFPFVKNVLVYDNTTFNNGSAFQPSPSQQGLDNILIRTMDTSGNSRYKFPPSLFPVTLFAHRLKAHFICPKARANKKSFAPPPTKSRTPPPCAAATTCAGNRSRVETYLSN